LSYGGKIPIAPSIHLVPEGVFLMKVLLVDDTLTDRLVIKSYLKSMGHEIVIGENGEQAVSLFASEAPDLVLLDVIMPVMDGYEAARRIRASTAEWIPIIFLSAKTTAEDIAAGIEAGGDDYLLKPVDQLVITAKMGAMERIATMRRKLIEVSEALEDANAELQRLACVDGLTDLTNRRELDLSLMREARRCARQRAPLSVVMIDIDHFKAFNDTFGHLEGDECLRRVAGALRAQLKRPADIAARYGGEEFCLVLPDTDSVGAKEVAESVRQRVEALGIPQAPKAAAGTVTVSLGVATCLPGGEDQAHDLIQRADQALYKAKDSGRNRVEVASSNPSAS
jgi:diguanylate cyclase (GGDEF)-like protein